MRNARGQALVHELLEVKVQILKHEEEFPLTMQHLNQAEGAGWWSCDSHMTHIMCYYLTMLGWSSSLSRDISLIAVEGTPSHSL